MTISEFLENSAANSFLMTIDLLSENRLARHLAQHWPFL